MTSKDQLVSLVVFLLSKGIISRAKCAQVMGINLADLSYEYDSLIDQAINYDRDDG